ncbi:MAG: TetR/AcrR family transcriptional regulator [Betaproteobacteria bacterium]
MATAAKRRTRATPPRDPERTRARILAAATTEFARCGLGGARVDRIAAEAETNKRMLYYYFGNKEALFLAVLEATYADIRTAETRLKLDAVEPVAGIRRLVEFTWRYYLANPHFLTLLNSENLHRARHLKASPRIAAMHPPFIATLADLLRRGEIGGSIRPGIDPVQLYISIAALSYFYLSNNHTLSAIFVRDLMSPRARAARLRHMTELVTAALRLQPH